MIQKLKPTINKGIYFDIRRYLKFFSKYNSFFIYGPRGDGKTTSGARYLINEWKRTGKRFLVVWQTQDEAKEKKKNFFEVFPKVKVIGMDVFWEEHEEKVLKDGSIKRKLISQKRIGRIDALNNSSKIRGGTYTNFSTIYWDEFMDEKKKYISGLTDSWFSICETIGRTYSHMKFLAVSNEVDPDCPIFNALKMTNIDEIEPDHYKLISHRKMVLIRLKTSETLRKLKAKSSVGYMTKGTDYAKYAYDNEWKNNKSSQVVGDVKGFQKPTFNVALMNQKYGVYQVEGKREWTWGVYISYH